MGKEGGERRKQKDSINEKASSYHFYHPYHLRLERRSAMKSIKRSKILGLVLSIVLLVAMGGMPAPALATNGAVILHPGYLSGSIAVTGQVLTYVTVRAIDTEKVYSASVTVSVPGGASSIEYNLTVEGDRDYYVIAEARLVATDYTNVVLPMAGPVNVPIGATVPLNLSVEPASISGTISTTTGGNTIENFRMDAKIWVPQFNLNFWNRTYAYSLSEPGQPGRDYTLLVTPGLDYYFYAYITINGVQYNLPSETVTAPAAGGTLTRDFSIDVTAATISGTALLQGTDVYLARVYGYSSWPPPYKSVNTQIADISSGAYTLDVTAGTWNVYPYFYFHLTGDLSGLNGWLRPPWTQVPDVNSGGHVTDVNFIIDPGFITGTVSLTGANTDIISGYMQAYSWPTTNGYMRAPIHPDTGDYMFVASAGDWRYYYLYLYFDYPDDPDTSLRSYLYRSGYFGDEQTVTSDQTVSGVNLTYGTATVRLFYYVEGGGVLSSPYLIAKRTAAPYLTAYAYGSPVQTTQGQAITTLLPGTYTIEAFANVEGSQTEFGTFTVSVEEGDVVVIGGPARPTIKVTNPTDGEVIPTDSVTVEGTATDDVGIASITINGEDVTFTSTGNPDDPNEVAFSHEVSLPDVGENTITVVATDVDGTPPVTLILTAIREEPPVISVYVDIKPGSCPNPLNLKTKGVLPAAILGAEDFDVTTIDPGTIQLSREVIEEGVAPIRWSYEDVATPFTGELCDCHDLNQDGYVDLTLKFKTQELVSQLKLDQVTGETIPLTLTGNLKEEEGGTPITGQDCIWILK